MMSELKPIIAKNIIDLRRDRNLTQAELAAALHYSDKAVSKWERGESIPDVTVLKQIADLFEVTVDYLLQEEHTQATAPTAKQASKWRIRNHGFITGISVVLVWLVATCVFAVLDMAIPQVQYHWLAFVFAVPVSMIVWLVFNSIWFNPKLNFLIISFLMWTAIFAVWLTSFLCLHWNGWLLFIIGIPAQVIIGMWTGIRHKLN